MGETVEFAGLHAGPPGFKFIIFPRIYQTMEFPSIKCLNKDGISVTLSIQFQLRANESHLKEVIMNFKDYSNYESIIR